VLRVWEHWIRHAIDTPKSQAGERTVTLGKRISHELFARRCRSPFAGDEEGAFAHLRTGNAFDIGTDATLFRKAHGRAGVDGRVRLFHDLRHSSITNSAAAGTPPEALMARAGHSDYAAACRFVDLAGERFRAEADRLEERLWGSSGTNSEHEVVPSHPETETAEGATQL